jgi:transposase
MTFDSQAEAMSREEIISLLKTHHELQQSYEELQRSHDDLLRQVEWFKRQLFGSKSERRVFDPEGRQLTLGEMFRSSSPEVQEIEIAGYRRRSKSGEDRSDEEALRFDPSVPVEEILVLDPEMEGENLEDYELVGEKVTCRLAQRPGSYVVLRYVRKVYKRKEDEAFSCPPVPPSVVERSFADVSFLAGLLIDKFVYHLPLYRQHQRLEAAGVRVSRGTLTNLVHRTAGLLEPIYDAQMESIMASEVLAMDETPIKAGRKKRGPPHRGQMKTAYFWPIYGDRDEVAFPFATTRSSAVVKEALKDFSGKLLTDGYKVYEFYDQGESGVVHAQCWSHARRFFEKAESSDPKRVQEILSVIAQLYVVDAAMKIRTLSPEQVLEYRAEHAQPIVDRFFAKLREIHEQEILLPKNPLRKAIGYAMLREKALRVFLTDPKVSLDTNHLERAIRPIALGRKNWLFCWTEIGAKYVGIIQSLLSTCKVQRVDPYVYLVDVLQRIETHPAKDVATLIPRLWKEHFSVNPLRSDIDRA